VNVVDVVFIDHEDILVVRYTGDKEFSGGVSVYSRYRRAVCGWCPLLVVLRHPRYLHQWLVVVYQTWGGASTGCWLTLDLGALGTRVCVLYLLLSTREWKAAVLGIHCCIFYLLGGPLRGHIYCGEFIPNCALV
jgi:hypothetical protein